MTPVIHCSIGSAILVPRIAFSPRKGTQSTRYDISNKYIKLKSFRRLLLSQSSLRLFQLSGSHYSSGIRTVAAVGTDVTVEEPNPAVSGEAADENSETSSSPIESSAPAPENTAATSPPRSKRPRPVRRSEMPPVKDEELVPGVWFTGKVRSIQPFGCFVDIGAFTEGLVHVSRMSDAYVKDVASFVSIGQEVKVRVVEANKETGRISLTMRENDDTSKTLQKTESAKGESNEKSRPARKDAPRPSQKREDMKKSSKFGKGQILDGTVRNVTRSGAFVSLPEGEEGFLPVAEESEGFGGILGSSSLQVGQEVKVRVLRISRGKVTLTMKKEEDVEGLNKKLNKGVVHVATNPFQLAFRQNKEIAAFLDERERTEKSSENLQQAVGKVAETLAGSDVVVEGTEISNVEGQPNALSDSSTELGIEKSTSDKLQEEAQIEDSFSKDVEIMDGESPSKLSKSADVLITEDEESSKAIDGLSSDSVLDEVPVIEETKDTIAANDTVEDVLAPKEEEISTTSNGSASETIIDDIPATGDMTDPIAANDTVQNVLAPTENDTVEDISAPKDDDVSRDLDGSSSDLASGEVPAINDAKAAPTANDIIQDVLVPEHEKLSETLTDSSSDSIVDETPANDTLEEQNLSSESLTELAESSENGSSISPALHEASPAYKDKEAKNDFTSIQDIKGASITETSIVAEGPVDDAVTDSNVTAGTVLLDVTNISTLGLEEIESPVDSASSQTQPTEGVLPSQVAISQSENAITNMEIGKDTIVGNEASDNLENAKVEAADSSDTQTGQGSPIKSTISPALVKQLREETGAGMMDCKKALAETGGDILKAQEYLRKKGLASADKKASRATAEGRIGSYIHDNRIGVLIEVNCETDFVSRGEIFKELVDDLAMQIAACPQVSYLVTEDVPQDIVDKERDLEMQKEDLLTKPENIRSKIVDGRIKKRLEELSLLEQPYIKNDKMAVGDWIKQTIATIGENIKVRRFARYNLGEGLEKKSQDFAAEVAAQTAANPSTSIPQQQTAEPKEVVQKPSTVTVSAALVKQLREETGTGMMDCKKALAETGGDLEKAQEYLRKKGLSSAEKKSSRLAAEGRIASYIHDTRIGALIEVNCETDFVGRNEQFKELVEDLAMQVVACPQVEFVSIEDIPESIIKKEKEIEMQREDLKSKPEQMKEKIVEGRITKRLGELALLEQPFIKDDSIKVKDLVKQTVASLGENIKVRRFVRFTLGESKN